MDGDVIVVGGGLAGLVAAHELVQAGKRVALVDQENPANLGGQAFWSFGGLFLVNSPEQRKLGVRDSVDLAWRDWRGSAGWDRLDGPLAEDDWAVRWGRAYVEFAAGEKRAWLKQHGISLTPMVGWAERGGGQAFGHGNSVPRFHVAWGTGTGVSEPFADRARTAAKDGRLTFHHRRRVDRLLVEGGRVTGVAGAILASDDAPRGAPSNRNRIGDFTLRAGAVVLASGGIGGDHEKVRRFWPERLGSPPKSMITGVPAYVDGRMLDIAGEAGARLVNRDRMWHYVEGVQNWDPIWPKHAIRILPGPSPLWLDALGRRLPSPGLPGHDTMATLRHLRTTPDLAEHDHSWFIVSQKILEKEFALSGSEQNLDITERKLLKVLMARLGKGAPPAVDAFKHKGADFVFADDLETLVARMNGLTERPLLDPALVRRQVEDRDAQMDNPYAKDFQAMSIHNSRRHLGDRLARTATPHRLLDPKAGPLIGVRLHVLTRKSLGGLQTDLSSQVLKADGTPFEGLYAAGEAAGFGGGGLHGYNALEGTFLGGCIFSGRAAGRALAGRV
ncbi:putative oxidoreductase [Brevundimonas bullata]|uniref:Putative oxidoreductase n=1 Tax=Brevundimonas bullata TaxID=13160 RepID=A0A7W7IS56_9CAUL|nr:FAD-binding dehydrogenase [Brevundimonas bullata]MBB4799553.1 putative oxidoreductase [Brevundimonas bullata]MBB6384376.1 putative oxidoreductase [Brevundimonas bullata]